MSVRRAWVDRFLPPVGLEDHNIVAAALRAGHAVQLDEPRAQDALWHITRSLADESGLSPAGRRAARAVLVAAVANRREPIHNDAVEAATNDAVDEGVQEVRVDAGDRIAGEGLILVTGVPGHDLAAVARTSACVDAADQQQPDESLGVVPTDVFPAEIARGAAHSAPDFLDPSWEFRWHAPRFAEYLTGVADSAAHLRWLDQVLHDTSTAPRVVATPVALLGEAPLAAVLPGAELHVVCTTEPADALVAASWAARSAAGCAVDIETTERYVRWRWSELSAAAERRAGERGIQVHR
jgi:hypothetical protein